MKSCYLWCVSRKVCDYLEQALYFGERFCAKSFLLVTWTAFLLRIAENNDLVKHLVNLPVFRKVIRRKSLLPEIGLLSGLLESNRFQSRLEEARVAPSCTELRVYYPMNQKSSIFKKSSRSTSTITVSFELALVNKWYICCLLFFGSWNVRLVYKI